MLARPHRPFRGALVAASALLVALSVGATGVSAWSAGSVGSPAQLGSVSRAAPAHHPKPVTVFVAGDSTASTWPLNTAPKAGWGQALPLFLAPARVTVVNRAHAGASSKTFIRAGRLNQILAAIRPGDYLLISFGHNDEKHDERHTEPYTTYQQYLTQYIEGARQHHAIPVLITPAERRRFDDAGQIKASHGQYPQAMRDLGLSLAVPVIDLTASSTRLWNRVGVKGSKQYFDWLSPGQTANWPTGSHDNTHFQAHGAIELARLVTQALVGQQVLPGPLTVGLNRPVPDSALFGPAQM